MDLRTKRASGKKTDKPQPDVKEPARTAGNNEEVDLQTAESIDDQQNAEEEEEAEESVKSNSSKSNKSADGGRRSAESAPKKQTKADLEEISDNESGPEDDKSEVSEKHSNSPRRRATRKE